MSEIIQGDCCEVMQFFKDNSIDLTVTSPPYDNLRDYKGYTFDFEGIARELYRVTKDGGIVVWIVNDATIAGTETGTSFRQALFFKEIGFNLHDTMIWEKSNPMPQTKVGMRYTLASEFMFIFSKGKIKTFNPITIQCKTAGEILSPSTQKRKDGTKSQTRLNAQIGKIINETKQLTNVWKISAKINVDHPAPFPEALARDHIISWSNEGDTVLDPMCGSGTTCKMAHNLKRNYIGIDISEEYCKIARERLQGQSSPLL